MDNELYETLEGAELNESGNTEEVADPQTEAEGDEGGNVQEVAEPETNKSDTESEQSPEQNAIYAAARRKAEAEAKAKYEKMMADLEDQKNAMYRNSGIFNPYTGALITTKEEYEAYTKQNAETSKRNFMEQTGLTEAEYVSLINSLPEVIEARSSQAAAKEAEARAEMDAQIKEIGKLDPSIKTIDDLIGMENYDRFFELVSRGNTFLDAYRLANIDKLATANAVAERQRALNAANSKSHLNATKGIGSGGVVVPDDVKREYRLLNPGITDKEMERHYGEYLKGIR